MGILDSIFGSGGEDDYNRAADQLSSIPLPVLKEYYPDLYEQVVSLNPEMESAVTLGPSEMAGIATDPGLRNTQMKALNRLQEIGDAGGMDAQFLSDSNRVLTDVNAANRGREGAIQQNLATRGLSGGMSELVQRNLSAQNASNQQAQSALDLKAQAEQRALASLMNSGQLANQIQGQDFNQASAKAQAADSIAKFNAQNLQGVNSRNTATKNNAQQWNAQNAQTAANSNVGAKNEAQQYNLGLGQQNFNNQIKKAGGVADQYNAIGQSKDKERQEDKGFVGGLISGGFQAFA